MPAEDIHQTVDHLFRHESGKMVSVLSGLLGLQNLETAQDIVQDTLLQAMSTWRFKGLPDNPQAWLYRVARNKAVDYLRREKKFREISPKYSYLLQSEYTLSSTVDQLFLEDGIQDSQLRMIFACCHPSISPESQVAFALKTLCGLSSAEIARSFLTSEETIAKRIYRAKEKIRSERIELELPAVAELPARLNAVLSCLYLLFNEGYNSSHPDQLIREELCHEAMRLGYLLTGQPVTNLPRVQALMALFCFQASRLRARIDDKGHIILLKHQDRSKWYRPLMQKGFGYLESSMSLFEFTPYHIEAAIASMHAVAPSFEKTDWKAILFLYDKLQEMQPGPVVYLNKAIAKAYAIDRQAALEELLQLKGLDNYHLYYTTLGELYFELHDHSKARRYYQKALALTPSRQEQQLLQAKIANCSNAC
ncbi:MAG TPA: sigma-70 family RNA polymerase sigma factor [Flavisolibacter sp.]|nr:sigma-70 family RNA polymerase sigma factor [Flavisolibacter sp.]